MDESPNPGAAWLAEMPWPPLRTPRRWCREQQTTLALAASDDSTSIRTRSLGNQDRHWIPGGWMMRRFACASLVALGLAATAGAAQAQAPDTTGRVSSGGNIVGGGLGATIVGGGDDLVVQYNQAGAGAGRVGWAQAGQIARFAGSHGDGPQIEYVVPAPAGSGREAWLVGGSDNAEVIYAPATGR